MLSAGLRGVRPARRGSCKRVRRVFWPDTAARTAEHVIKTIAKSYNVRYLSLPIRALL